jgi:hypothetical protein
MQELSSLACAIHPLNMACQPRAQPRAYTGVRFRMQSVRVFVQPEQVWIDVR